MSEKDKGLIEKARMVIWERCCELEQQCESEEARSAIRAIEKRKFYNDKIKSDL